MTIENYTTLSNKELIECIEHLNINPIKLSIVLKHHYGKIYSELIGRTWFLEPDSSMFARIFCLKNNISSHPTCQNPGCTNKVSWNRNKREFFHHCSNKCKNEDPTVQEKMKETTISHFGVEHAA